MAFIFGFTPRQQVQDFVRQMTDLGSKRIPRAVQFALNGVAIESAILVGLGTPISGGASSFNVVFSKVNSGGTTVLGTVTMAAGDIVKPLALAADLELGDVLAIAQVGGGSSTGGANLSISVPLQIGHAI